MARKTGLREYQQALTERLQEVQRSPAAASKLGFIVGSERWLVDIEDIDEVLPCPEITRLPLTQPWFLGIASIRGDLVGVVDLMHFLTRTTAPRAPHNRLVTLSAQAGARSSILVSRMLGLKRSSELRARSQAASTSALVRNIFEDGDGTVWKELDARGLMNDRRFLDVSAS